MLTLLFRANLVLPDRIRRGYVIVEDAHIRQVGLGDGYPRLPYDRMIDVAGDYLAPGFVELHSHGAGGADFMDGTLDAFAAACHTHLCHGTTTLLPTALAATREEILRSIDCFGQAKSALAGNRAKDDSGTGYPTTYRWRAICRSDIGRTGATDR